MWESVIDSWGCICFMLNSWHIPPLGRTGITSWRSGQELGKVAFTLIRNINLGYLLPWRGWVFPLHQWPPTFRHQGAVWRKTIFAWISGWGRWLDGFRVSPSALHLLCTLFLLLLHQLHLRSSGIRSQSLGTPALHKSSVKSSSFPRVYYSYFQFGLLLRVAVLHLNGSVAVCVQVLSRGTFWSLQLSSSY